MNWLPENIMELIYFLDKSNCFRTFHTMFENNRTMEHKIKMITYINSESFEKKQEVKKEIIK